MSHPKSPYLTNEVMSALWRAHDTASTAVGAALERDAETAYERLIDAFHELHSCENDLFAALHIECPECGMKSAPDQKSACPCCQTLNSAIPRHMLPRIERIWYADPPVVTCPVCDGDEHPLVDDQPGTCPACGGAGAMHREDAIAAVIDMHYNAQGLGDENEG